MRARLKKRILNFFIDIFSTGCLILAISCVVLKMQKTSASFSDVGFVSAKTLLPRGKIYISSENKISDNKILDEGKAESVYDPHLENSKFSAFNFSENITKPDDENDEKHKPGEKTYKIIESQFGASGVKFENFYIRNSTNKNVNFAKIFKDKPEVKIKNTKDPQVLILHTHATESYMKRDQGFFYESSQSRSENDEKNVVKVGREITEKLKCNGINAIHVTTHHDSPGYNGSYSRAAKTIKENLVKYPSIQVVLDIHRDGLGSKETGKVKPTFVYKGKKAAQIMVVAGFDDNNSLGHPNWEKNLRLALRLQNKCEELFPNFTRPMHFARVKYNEHLTPGSLLIEVGSDASTLEEAIRAGNMLGEAIAKTLRGLR